MYCIYTDTDVPKDRGNFDHVYPLSLGGTNHFVIWSDAVRNSEIGSQIDGALVKDPFISFALRKVDVRGHGPRRDPIWPKSELQDGRPVQVTWGRETVKVWSAREKRVLLPDEYAGQQIGSNLILGAFTALRFTARVALAGGYFLYGDLFRTAVDCNALREAISLDKEAMVERSKKGPELKYCDRFDEDSEGAGPAAIYRALCEGVRRSVFIAVPQRNSIHFHVGILGYYIGSMIVPADTTGLPVANEHDLGHAIILSPGVTSRMSFRELLLDYQRALNRRITPLFSPEH